MTRKCPPAVYVRRCLWATGDGGDGDDGGRRPHPRGGCSRSARLADGDGDGEAHRTGRTRRGQRRRASTRSTGDASV